MPSPRKASPAAHAEAGPMPCSLRVSDTASWAGWELQRSFGWGAGVEEGYRFVVGADFFVFGHA